MQIGKITHYYDKIGVAVVTVVNHPLKVGTIVKISGHDKEFTQAIQSLQIDRKPVDHVDAGESVGLKVDQPVKSGDVMYLVPGK